VSTGHNTNLVVPLFEYSCMMMQLHDTIQLSQLINHTTNRCALRYVDYTCRPMHYRKLHFAYIL